MLLTIIVYYIISSLAIDILATYSLLTVIILKKKYKDKIYHKLLTSNKENLHSNKIH